MTLFNFHSYKSTILQKKEKLIGIIKRGVGILSFVVLFLLSGYVPAQIQYRIDSLWTAFNNSVQDTNRIILLNEKLGYLYEETNADSALFCYKKAIEISDNALKDSNDKIRKRYLSLKFNSLRYVGIIHLNRGEYAEAIDSYTLAFNIALDLKDEARMAESYTGIGRIYYTKGQWDEALDNYNKSLELRKKLNNKKGISGGYTDVGIVLWNKGEYESAIEYYRLSLAIEEELEDLLGMAGCYTNIGIIQWSQGIYDKAIENFFKSMKIYEEAGNIKGIALCSNNIGLIQGEQRNYKEAIEYYKESIRLYEKINDRKNMSDCYNNLGNVYLDMRKYEMAISNYLKSLEICISWEDKIGMAHCYNNIGVVRKSQGRYSSALENFMKTLKLNETLGNKNGLANIYGNIAELHLCLSDSSTYSFQRTAHLDTALEFGLRSYNSAVEIEALPIINDASSYLKNIYKKRGNYEKALEYAEIFISSRDTMFSEEKTKALAEMGAKYESEKKQLQIDNLNKENALKVAELAQSEEKRNRQLVMIYSFVLGFIIILVFSVILFRLFLQKRRANILLAAQKEQIELQNSNLQQANEEINAQRDEIASQRDLVMDQKDRIEEQKKEIEDSIHYAKRIQHAVLPDMSLISRQFSSNGNQLIKKVEDPANKNHFQISDYFVLFKPKDVVSGDFYWTAKTEEWTVVTVADCTGHGVPGAFMSMLGVSFLNEIVRKNEVSDTGTVLDYLRNSVIDALKQTGETGTQKDGMDMSIIAIHNFERKAMWSGANNPVWIIRDANHSETDELSVDTDLLIEVKADKMPVAVHERMDPFTTHDITLNSGDSIYLLTDGYPDQFGGPNGKKFKHKALKKLLVEIKHLPMADQKAELEKVLDNWIGKGDQIDDITIMGLRIL